MVNIKLMIQHRIDNPSRSRKIKREEIRTNTATPDKAATGGAKIIKSPYFSKLSQAKGG